MNAIRRHLSYANVVATLALFFAMSGGALAAKHYLINSTKQINPKVLKKLKGNTGARGPAGAQGLAGAQGTPGTPGKEGAQGKDGPRGPSDAYEVVLAKSTAFAQHHTLTLSNVPAGTYVIFGKVDLVPGERKSGSIRCELTAGNDVDLTQTIFTALGSGFEGAPARMQLTHTFESTGEVTMSCGCESAIPSAFSTNPAARIVAIRVENLHTTTTEAT